MLGKTDQPSLRIASRHVEPHSIHLSTHPTGYIVAKPGRANPTPSSDVAVPVSDKISRLRAWSQDSAFLFFIAPIVAQNYSSYVTYVFPVCYTGDVIAPLGVRSASVLVPLCCPFHIFPFLGRRWQVCHYSTELCSHIQ